MPMLQIGELAKELKDDCTATIDIPLIASVIKKILVDNNIDTEKDSVEET